MKLYEALIGAIMGGHQAIALTLLKNGAPTKAPEGDITSAINLAASQGQGKVVSLLIALGANVEEVDSEGCRPLLRATMAGHVDVVATLLDAGRSRILFFWERTNYSPSYLGANPEVKDERSKEDALAIAVRKNLTRIIDLIWQASGQRRF